VLLVEDEKDIRDLYADMLRGEGYEVDVASSVAEATAMLGRAYTLVITDWRLPDGDGTLIADMAEQLTKCQHDVDERLSTTDARRALR